MTGHRARALSTEVSIGVGMRKQRGNMFGIAQNPSTRKNPSTRIVFNGPLCLRAVTLALLGALLVAATAPRSPLAPAQAPDPSDLRKPRPSAQAPEPNNLRKALPSQSI